MILRVPGDALLLRVAWIEGTISGRNVLQTLARKWFRRNFLISKMSKSEQKSSSRDAFHQFPSGENEDESDWLVERLESKLRSHSAGESGGAPGLGAGYGKRPNPLEFGLKRAKYSVVTRSLRVLVVGVPPLTHDRASSLQTKNTVPVDTLNDCAFLYISENKTEQYFPNS
jgi:hypothetical protein